MLTAEDLQLFATIGASPSLAAAARSLGVTPPAVSQRLKLIEGRLGLRLVERSGKGLRMTSDGELIVARSAEILGQVSELEEELAARRGVAKGSLRIVAPLGFGRRFITPLVAAYHGERPDMRVELLLSDRPGIDLSTACDILIRIGEQRDSDEIATVLAPNRRILCAAPAYLARCGTPTTPSDLLAHRCIALRENDEDVTLWRFRSRQDNAVSVRVPAVLSSNDGEVTKALALAGLGVTIRSEWDVSEDFRRGDLIPLLEDWALPDANITALLGPKGARSARVSDFLGLLRKSLKPVPWRY
ncbi:LysR family transcriptional regulator [Sphingopyxis kveilinensis]|uniref:LysR family transcriptional regulator n=1 Tax=Sphingopyxis kveilinensis TaxID=3114367 RepID=UPI0030CF6C96